MDIVNKNPGAGGRRGFLFCTVERVRKGFYRLSIISQRQIRLAPLVIEVQAASCGCCIALGSPRRLS